MDCRHSELPISILNKTQLSGGLLEHARSFSLDSLELACELKFPISQATWELAPWVNLGFDLDLLHFNSFSLAANLQPPVGDDWAKSNSE